MPNEDDVTCVGGGAKLGWLKRFVNVPSKRIHIRSVRWKLFGESCGEWTCHGHITRPLKIEAQRQLPRAISTKSLRKCGGQHAESALVADVQRGRREVRMIEHVGKGSLKP